MLSAEIAAIFANLSADATQRKLFLDKYDLSLVCSSCGKEHRIVHKDKSTNHCQSPAKHLWDTPFLLATKKSSEHVKFTVRLPWEQDHVHEEPHPFYLGCKHAAVCDFIRCKYFHNTAEWEFWYMHKAKPTHSHEIPELFASAGYVVPRLPARPRIDFNFGSVLNELREKYPRFIYVMGAAADFPEQSLRQQQDYWMQRKFSFPAWVAVFHDKHRSLCTRSNHKNGKGCDKDDCKFDHQCFLCQGDHGMFQRDGDRYVCDTHNEVENALEWLCDLSQQQLFEPVVVSVLDVLRRHPNIRINSLPATAPTNGNGGVGFAKPKVQPARSTSTNVTQNPVPASHIVGNPWQNSSTKPSSVTTTGGDSNRHANGNAAHHPKVKGPSASSSLASNDGSAATSNNNSENDSDNDSSGSEHDVTEYDLTQSNYSSLGLTRVLRLARDKAHLICDTANASVYSGDLQEMGNTIPVAVKMWPLPKRKEAKKHLREVLQREYNALSVLAVEQQSHIVRFLGCAEFKYPNIKNGERYIAIWMEKCEQNLQQFVDNQVVPEWQNAHNPRTGTTFKLTDVTLQNFVLQLLTAYYECHENQICHRAVKPANILIWRERDNSIRLKLCDFALSQLLGGEQASTTNTIADTTNEPCWFAPEVLEMGRTPHTSVASAEYKQSSDIWSLGCVLYFLFTCGVAPFGKSEDVRRAASEPKFCNSSIMRHSLHTKFPLLFDLIRRMLQPQQTRISAKTALLHPFLWSPARLGEILAQISNEITDSTSPKAKKFASHLLEHAKHILQEKGWVETLPTQYVNCLRGVSENHSVLNQPHSPVALLRAIRNLRTYFQNLHQQNSTMRVSELHAMLMKDVVLRFPTLVPIVWDFGAKCGKWTRTANNGVQFTFE